MMMVYCVKTTFQCNAMHCNVWCKSFEGESGEEALGGSLDNTSNLGEIERQLASVALSVGIPTEKFHKKPKQNIYAHSEYIAMAWRRFFTSAQPPPPSLTRFLKLWTFCFKPYNLLLLAFFVFVYWDLKVKLRDLCQILIQGDSHRKMFFDRSLIGYPSRYIHSREPLRLWTGNIWAGGATILCHLRGRYHMYRNDKLIFSRAHVEVILLPLF